MTRFLVILLLVRCTFGFLNTEKEAYKLKSTPASAAGSDNNDNNNATTPTPTTTPAPTTTPPPATTAATPTATVLTVTPITEDPNNVNNDTQTTAPLTTTPASEATKTPPTEPATTMETIHDEHRYYTVTTTSSDGVCGETCRRAWIDITSFPENRRKMYNLTSMTAENNQLVRDFLFYGHRIRNITMAAGGFLHMDEFKSGHLTKTRYIAPLMAHLHLNADDKNNSGLHYAWNDTVIVFEWHNMQLLGQTPPPATNMTFQVQLYVDNSIRFVYASLPVPASSIPDDQHDVKAGISDGYESGRRMYEYDTVDVLPNVKEGVIIQFTPFPTCIELTNCTSCLSNTTMFLCEWCQTADDGKGRCSDSMDRHRVSWFKTCDKHSIKKWMLEKDRDICATLTTPAPPAPPTTPPTTPPVTQKTPPTKQTAPTEAAPTSLPTSSSPPTTQGGKGGRGTYSPVAPCHGADCHPFNRQNTGGSSAGVGIIVVAILLLIALGLVVYYAYKNPGSKLGMWFIQCKTTCCRSGAPKRSSEEYQVFVESDIESMPL